MTKLEHLQNLAKWLSGQTNTPFSVSREGKGYSIRRTIAGSTIITRKMSYPGCLDWLSAYQEGWNANLPS
jgi:hypothetical protein